MRKNHQGRKNRPNLERFDGGLIKNKHGVYITEDEKRELERAVNKANNKRKKQLEKARKMVRKLEGEIVDDRPGALLTMGRETDFILAKKSKSVHRFRSRGEFDRYMERLNNINDPNYIPNRIRAYKRNFTSSLLETYGDQAKDIAMKIRMMKPEKYMEMVEQDEALEIGYYGDSGDYIPGMLNKLRRALGMKEKEEWPEEYR